MNTKKSPTQTKNTDTEPQVKLVKGLAEILDKTQLLELEYETEHVSIRLSRVAPAAPAQTVMPQPAPAMPQPAPAAPPATSTTPTPQSPDTTENNPNAITSPMVGTAYLAPEPGAANFINQGDTVKEGQTLVIIEAMKVMNPITAPKAGTVKAILVSNAQPVEYGEALVIVE